VISKTHEAHVGQQKNITMQKVINMIQQYMIHYNNTENRQRNRPKYRANSE